MLMYGNGHGLNKRKWNHQACECSCRSRRAGVDMNKVSRSSRSSEEDYLQISPAAVPSPRVYKQFIYVPFGRCHDALRAVRHVQLQCCCMQADSM
jgi:hypothetical protein